MTSTSHHRQATALVVDDDVPARTTVADAPGQAGPQALEARGGDAAPDLIAGREPEVALPFSGDETAGIRGGLAPTREVASRWPDVPAIAAPGRALRKAGELPGGLRRLPAAPGRESLDGHPRELRPRRSPATGAAGMIRRFTGTVPRRALALAAAVALLVPAAAGAEPRIVVPPALRASAALCLGEALRLCPAALSARDHGLSCILGKRRLLSAPCRDVYDQGLRLLRGQDLHLTLRRPGGR